MIGKVPKSLKVCTNLTTELIDGEFLDEQEGIVTVHRSLCEQITYHVPVVGVITHFNQLDSQHKPLADSPIYPIIKERMWYRCKAEWYVLDGRYKRLACRKGHCMGGKCNIEVKIKHTYHLHSN